MSKSLWSRSVWNSLFNRTKEPRRLARQRRSLRPSVQYSVPIESLEQRLVLTAPLTIQYDSGVLSLTSAVAGNQVVTVKAGAAFTDVLVNGKLTARLESVTSIDIDEINFNGMDGTGDSLSVTGITADLDVNLTAVEKLQLNTGDATSTTTVNSTGSASASLTLVTSTVSGELEVFHNANIVQSGKLIVSGTAQLEANGGAADIILKTTGNSFGALDLNAKDVTITEVGPTDFVTSVITGSLTVVSSGAITAGAGDLTLTPAATGAFSLTSNGSSINVVAGIAVDAVPVSLKGSNITFDDTDGDIALKTITASANFTLTTSDDSGAGEGDVTQAAGSKISVGGLATITTVTTNFDDDITLNTGTVNVGSWNLAGEDISIVEKSSTDLNGVEATGALTLTSSGAITDSDEINVALGTILSAKSAPITLDDATNTFGGTITSSGTNINLVDTSATDLGVTTAKGTFTLTSGGNVTQTGNLTVSGLFTVDAGTNAITLNDGLGAGFANKFGAISVTGGAVTIEEADASNLFDSNITTSFVLNSGNAVTDSGTMMNDGTTTITAAGGKSITLDDALSEYGNGAGDTISLTTTGTGVLINAAASELGGISLKSFTLTSAAAVTQTDTTTINIAGRMTVNAAGSNITLATSGAGNNTFGSLSLFGDDVSVTEGKTGATSDTDLFNSEITGTFSLTTFGAVTDSGVVKVDGTTTIVADSNGAAALGKENITLNSVGSTYGDATANELNLDGATVYVADYSDETNLGAITTSGTLTIAALGGDIDDDGDITVGTTSTFNANGNDITLDNTDNTFTGSISLFGDVATLTTGANAQGAADADVVLGTTKVTQLAVTTANGNLSQSGAINVLDELSLETGTADVNLATGAGAGFNSFGYITIPFGGGNIGANDVNILERGGMLLSDMTVSGTLNLTATGGITDTDPGYLNPSNVLTPIAGVLLVTGVATINANGGDLLLQTTDSEFNDQVNLIGENIEITNHDTNGTGVNLGAVTATGDFTLTSTSDMGDSGAVVQTLDATVGGLATVTASTNGVAANITLNIGSNSFGKIAFNGANVTISEDDADGTLISEEAEATGNLTITSLGDVTSEVEINVGLVTTISADTGAGLIELTDVANTFTGALVLSGSAVTIVNDTATILGTATGEVAVESLTLTTDDVAGVSVTQPGDLTVTDFLNITATGSVDLNSANAGGIDTNIGTLRIGGTATSANIRVSSELILDGVELSGDLTIVAETGDVTDASGTDSGNIEVSGATSITATAGDIILDHTTAGGNYFTDGGQPDSFFGDGGATDTVTLSGINVFLAAVDDLILGNITATGDLNISTDGNVTNEIGTGLFGRFNITGDTTIDVTLGGGAGTIELDLFNAAGGASNFGATPFFTAAPGNVDTTNPTVVVSGLTAVAAGSYTVTFTFDTAVENFFPADVTIVLGGGATFTPTSNSASFTSGTGTVFTLTGTTTAGTISFSVIANRAQEVSSGIGNLLSNTLVVTVS